MDQSGAGSKQSDRTSGVIRFSHFPLHRTDTVLPEHFLHGQGGLGLV